MRLDFKQRGALAGLGLGLLCAVACGGESARGGTVVIATAQDPDGLFPPTHEGEVALQVSELLFDHLAERGPAMNTLGDSGFEPRLARRWQWARDSLSLTFELDPRARWHDGQRVRASDVRFAWSVYTDPLVASRVGGDLSQSLDSVSVRDSLTCVAWFKARTPEQFNTLVMSLTPLPEHVLGRTPRDSLRTSAFVRAPVGNGPFRFVRWDARQRVEIAANTDYYRGRPRLDRVIWSITPEMRTIVQGLVAGEADFVERLTPVDAAAAALRPDIRVVQRGNFDYAFVRFNFFDGPSDRPHPLFADRALRRAISMSLDRGAMVHNVLDTLGHTGLGPFLRLHWSADTTIAPLPFDTTTAGRTLDSLGWRRGADGMRARGTRALAFGMLVPTSSNNRQKFAVLIQEQLRQAGIKMTLEPVDQNTLGDRQRSRRFDAAFDALVPTPSPSGLRQTWTSTGTKPGGLNHGRYVNPAFDAMVDSAVGAADTRVAKERYRAAYRIAIDDAPAVWMFEPVQVAGVNKRLQVGALRRDGWWRGIPDWFIAPAARLPRDTAASTR